MKTLLAVVIGVVMVATIGAVISFLPAMVWWLFHERMIRVATAVNCPGVASLSVLDIWAATFFLGSVIALGTHRAAPPKKGGKQ